MVSLARERHRMDRDACVLSEEYAVKCSITSTQKSMDKRQGNRKPMQTL